MEWLDDAHCDVGDSEFPQMLLAVVCQASDSLTRICTKGIMKPLQVVYLHPAAEEV